MVKRVVARVVAVLVLVMPVAGCVRDAASTALNRDFFGGMMVLDEGRSARVSSYDRTGANVDFTHIEPGDTLELAHLEGAGCIRHIYFTIWPVEHYLRNLVLRMYWDGETSPSVEVPFGDFFGQGQERVRFFRSLMITVNPGAGGVSGTVGFNSYFPMPYVDGARLTLTNEGPETVGAVWYHIDYESLDGIPKNVGRFHAQWRRENPTTAVGEQQNVTIHNGINLDGKENFVILEAEGRGKLAGYFLNVDNVIGGWYGEGDDMIFIDGEAWPPSFHGTGSEEIFGGGACPNTEYAGPYTGFYLVGNRDFSGKVGMYRFYVTDPIRFQKSIRVTIEHGHANNFANDYSSTAFWYQAEPHGVFPSLPPAADRLPREGTDVHDMAYLKLADAREKLGKVHRRIQKKEISNVDEAVTAAQAKITEAELAFERSDFAAAAASCSEAIAVLEPLLGQAAQ